MKIEWENGAIWRLLACLGLLLITLGFVGLAQEDEGIELIREGTLGESGEEEPFTAGAVIIEPISVRAAVGYVATGSPWIELGAATTLWVGNVSLTASALLHGLAFSLDLEGGTQLGGVGVTAGARFTSAGMELSGGISSTLSEMSIAGHITFGQGALIANVSLSKDLNGMRLTTGAGWSGNQLQLSMGTTIPAGPLIISAAATLQGLGNIVVSGGLNLALTDGVAFFGSLSVDGGGIRLTGGGQVNLGVFELSGSATMDTQGLGIRANSRLNLGELTLMLAFRMDSNSQSYDLGASFRAAQFLNSVTVGLDPSGFKWVQVQIESELRLSTPKAVPQDQAK